MISTKQLSAAMIHLEEAVMRLEELVEWCKLAEQEHRPGRPFGFPLDRHLDEDFRSLYGLFCQLDNSIHQMLRELDAPADDYVADLKHRLVALEERVRSLNLPARFARN